jgi:alpha-ribazole phosphatase
MIDLLRHGATDRPGDFVGRTECALSEEGWRQFERQTAGRTWGAIVTSPLRRARAPAERLGAALGLTVAVDPDWCEIDLGDWDGKPFAALRADRRAADLMAQFYRDPASHAPSTAWLKRPRRCWSWPMRVPFARRSRLRPASAWRRSGP